LIFEIGDFVYLMVSPIRGLRCFKVRGKFAPIFIGPFKIMKKRGQMAYQLELPLQLSDVHDVFHVSQLKKYLRACHTRFLRPKPDAHRMYPQDQVVIHTVRM
jgi:hypothetical protein